MYSFFNRLKVDVLILSCFRSSADIQKLKINYNTYFIRIKLRWSIILQHLLTHLIIKTILVFVHHLPIQIVLQQKILWSVVKCHWWPYLWILQIIIDCLHDVVQVVWCVVVLSLVWLEMDLVLFTLIGWIKWVGLGNFVVYVCTYRQPSFIKPTSRYILYGVATSSQHHYWSPICKHMFDCLTMALNR